MFVIFRQVVASVAYFSQKFIYVATEFTVLEWFEIFLIKDWVLILFDKISPSVNDAFFRTKMIKMLQFPSREFHRPLNIFNLLNFELLLMCRFKKIRLSRNFRPGKKFFVSLFDINKKVSCLSHLIFKKKTFSVSFFELIGINFRSNRRSQGYVIRMPRTRV